MSAIRFHSLRIKRVSPEAAGSVAITLDIPADQREAFDFQPGQFLTLRANLNHTDVRRSYSISCPRSRLHKAGELEIGIRPVEGGLFSNWAAQQLKAGDMLEVMTPDGRFTVKKQRAIHRVGFAAGSGITPILSIAATTLEEQPASKFTVVYGNRKMSTVMFNEALQDLKDRYPDRLTLIHILSRQSQEVPLLQGRIDHQKILIPARGRGLLIEIPDAGEVAENPWQWVIALQHDRAFHLVSVRAGFGGLQNRLGEKVDVLVGLHINIRLAVIREDEKVQADRVVE